MEVTIDAEGNFVIKGRLNGHGKPSSTGKTNILAYEQQKITWQGKDLRVQININEKI